MATSTRAWPDIAIPPGELLAETLEMLGLSQAQLARRAGRPAQAINEIIRGRKEITPETAFQLERVLGVPAHVWTRLEADHRHNKARLADQARLKGEAPLAARYPYAALAARGWVRRTRDALERTEELLRFFAVGSLRQVPAIEAAAFRRSPKASTSSEALAAWLRQGEREAHTLTVAKFSAPQLRAALPEIRALTQHIPEEFEPRLRQLLADTGVALVLLPHLPRTGTHGATRWLNPDKALVQMSIRYRWADIFWFSLLHEIAHVLLHDRNSVFIEGANTDQHQLEREADRFAAHVLIPLPAFEAFCRRPDRLTRAAVRAFAQEIGIAPGIVVGRLHHEGQLRHSDLNGLRSRFAWAKRTGPEPL